MEKFVVKVLLWFDEVVDDVRSRMSTRALIKYFSIIALILGLVIFTGFGLREYIKYNKNQREKEYRVTANIERKQKSEKSFISNQEWVSVDKLITDEVETYPSDDTVENYMSLLVGMYDSSTRQSAHNQIPWSNDYVAGDLVTDYEQETNLDLRYGTLESFSKTYGDAQVDYVGIFFVEMTANNGADLTTYAVVNLSIMNNKVVAWSLTERNVL